MSERRRASRYPIEVPVTIAAAGVVQKTTTRDVSYGGIFAITERPPQISQLTRLQVELGDGQVLETHAIPVFTVGSDNEQGDPPGCGLKFYAMSEATRQRWVEFVDEARARFTAGPTSAAPRRRQVKFKPRVAVRPESVAALEELGEDIAAGAIQVELARPAEVGAPLRVDVVHPGSGAIFKLDGVVSRVIEELGGVEVRIDDLGDEGRAALRAFVDA